MRTIAEGLAAEEREALAEFFTRATTSD